MMSKGNHPTKRHKNCPIKVIIGPFGPHYARFECRKHRKFIKWATLTEVNCYNELQTQS